MELQTDRGLELDTASEFSTAPASNWKAIAASDNILALFSQRLRDCAFAGDTANAELLYLAFTSRLFSRPVSVLVKGHSGIGKNSLVDHVAAFFPEGAYIRLTGASEKAFIYDERDYSNRMLLVGEAAGIGGTAGNVWLRSLLSDGCIDYTVTIKDGLKSRHIHKEGPTGLITTTTANSLHPEDESRMLALSLDDSAEQIRKVLRAQAIKLKQTAQVDLGDWLQFHQWIAAEPALVAVPYAEQLAELVECSHHRINRAFGHLLALVMSHALIHKRSRDSRDGAVQASIEDYEAVRALIEPLVASSVEATVAPDMRMTVEAVVRLARPIRNRRAQLSTGGGT